MWATIGLDASGNTFLFNLNTGASLVHQRLDHMKMHWLLNYCKRWVEKDPISVLRGPTGEGTEHAENKEGEEK